MSGFGANTVSITATYYVDDKYSAEIVNDPQRTESTENTAIAIADAKARGMTVVLKPHLDAYDGTWRGSFEPTDIDAFFANYKAMILEQAAIAQAGGADMLSLGVEMDQLTTAQYRDYWIDIIEDVRAIYDGDLTYSAHWYDPAQVSFWDEVDIIGINPYVPVGTLGDSVEDFAAAWEETPAAGSVLYSHYGAMSPVEYYGNIAAQYDKDILFTELGYLSTDLGPEYPGYDDPNGTPNFDVQADLYEAFFQYWEQPDAPEWMKGVLFWNWYPTTDPGEIDHWQTDLTPQGKPAADVIDYYFSLDGEVGGTFTQEVTITVRAAAMSYAGDPEMTLVVNGLIVGAAEISAALFDSGWGYVGQWETVTFTAFVDATNGVDVQLYYDNDDVAGGDRNLFVDWIEVDGTRYEAENADNNANGGWIDPTMAPMVVNGVLTFADVAVDPVQPPPGPVVIDSDGGFTNAPQQAISGTAPAGSSVTVRAGTTPLGTAYAQADGTWSLLVTLPDNAESMLVASTTDAFGQTSYSSPVVFIVDTLAPDVTLTTPQTLVNGPFLISGTVADDAPTALDVLVDGRVVETSITVVNGVFEGSLDLSDGAHTIAVRATDAAGNTASSEGVEVTVDTEAPQIDAFELSGTAKGVLKMSLETSGDAVSVTLGLTDMNGTLVEGITAVPDSSGDLSTLLGTGAAQLPEGVYDLTLSATDAAGNATVETMQVEAEAYGRGTELRLIEADTITRHFFNDNARLTGIEIITEENGALIRTATDGSRVPEGVERISVSNGQLMREYFDPDMNAIANETIDLGSNGFFRHFFDADWNRTGAASVEVDGEGSVSSYFDAAWTFVGGAIRGVENGQSYADFFDQTWTFTGRVFDFAFGQNDLQREFYDANWHFDGAERTVGGPAGDTMRYFDDNWQATNGPPTSAGDFVASLDLLATHRADDAYEEMSNSMADLELMAEAVANAGSNPSMLDLFHGVLLDDFLA